MPQHVRLAIWPIRAIIHVLHARMAVLHVVLVLVFVQHAPSMQEWCTIWIELLIHVQLSVLMAGRAILPIMYVIYVSILRSIRNVSRAVLQAMWV